MAFPRRIFAWAKRSALALALVAGSFQAAGGPAAPVGLLVNGVRNPLAIDLVPARFTWRSAETGRGASQTAYQVLVSASVGGLAAGRAEWWDSGRVDSTRSAAIEYAGRPLPPGTRFWWKVRVWDQTGKPSRYSAPGCFDTGLGPNGWTARFIWDGTTDLNNFAYFRKTFTSTRKPELAKVYVTAHNDYLLYFNGQLLGRGPARCDPYCYGQYNAYDITQLLKTGLNVFAAAGHWQGNWNDSGINGSPAFRLEARLTFRDGSTSVLGTDASWKALADTGFIETNAVYFGGAGGGNNRAAIQFDSRREPADWQLAGFDDSRWAPATVVDRPDYKLCAQMAPVEREQAELNPVSIRSAAGAWLVDFGRCIDGWPKLTMRANHSGDRVRVQYFQMTDERKPSGWDQYICNGGKETWKPGFGRHASFQVLKITGYAGELNAADVRGVWAYCDAEVAGRFHCSSPLLNSIYEMCERSARQNVQQAIISVDANREQSPWTADSWMIGNVLLYNHGDTMMVDKVVRDYASEQLTNGDFYACSPAAKYHSPEWSMYWPMLLWQQYLFSGDESLLRTMAPGLAHFLEWLKTYQDPRTKLINPPDGTLATGQRISEYAGGNLPSGGYNCATACQYYENLRIAARVFSILGQTDQGAEYARQAEEVKDGINSNLFTGAFYLARTDRKEMFPLASAWALRFELTPAGAKTNVLAAIASAGQPDLGGYGGDAFYSGLLNAGGGTFVARDLFRYHRMLEENKANWERFDPGAEVNHAWTSYPGYLFQKYILGIQPTSGGFATFDVRPETGGLTFAEGAVPTIKGLITTRWEKGANGRFSLSIKVPPNTRAAIHIPKLSNAEVTITESGKLLWPGQSQPGIPGVLAVQERGSFILCLTSAGTYHFREMPPP